MASISSGNGDPQELTAERAEQGVRLTYVEREVARHTATIAMLEKQGVRLESGLANLDEKMTSGMRFLGKLMVGMLVLIAGAAAKIIFGGGG